MKADGDPARGGPVHGGPVRGGPVRGGHAHGHRGPAEPSQLGWALLVIAAALVGGLAGAALVHTSLTVAVIVSLIAGGITVLVVIRSSGRPPELAGGEAAVWRPGLDVPDDPDAATVPVPPASPHAPAGPDGTARGGPPVPGEALVQLLPLPPQPGTAPPDAPWWDSAHSAPPPPGPGARRAPAPDLSTYLAATLIAQCPRCGAFRLDIRQAGDGWDFRCQSCHYTWTWQPGTPWPPVRVIPGRGKESGPAAT